MTVALARFGKWSLEHSTKIRPAAACQHTLTQLYSERTVHTVQHVAQSASEKKKK